MSYLERKWQSNMEKVNFANAFPGRKKEWDEAVGKTIEAAVPFKAHTEGVVVVFSDGDFLIASKPPDTPQTVIASLEAARTRLDKFHAEAYERLDDLTERDREMSRLARMERIVDAVRNNMGEIPELRAALKELLSD